MFFQDNFIHFFKFISHFSFFQVQKNSFSWTTTSTRKLGFVACIPTVLHALSYTSNSWKYYCNNCIQVLKWDFVYPDKCLELSWPKSAVLRSGNVVDVQGLCHVPSLAMWLGERQSALCASYSSSVKMLLTVMFT